MNDPARPETQTPPRPPAAALLLAAVLALASALWAGFLWRQLWISRTGGDPFCPLGGGRCADLWDGPFATAIAGATGVPVAALGVVWGLVAAGLAAWAWRRAASGASPEPAWSGLASTAAVGVASVLGFAGVSLVEGSWCVTCTVTYALVLGVAACVGLASRAAPPSRLVPGGTTAALAAVALLFGLRVLAPAMPEANARFGAVGPERMGVGEFFATLSPVERQRVSDALSQWRAAEPHPAEVRALHGSIQAPVRITTWTDSLCSHCARFHESLEQLLTIVPPGSVAVVSRMFPLDGTCNPWIPATGDGLRCFMARARLCLEDHPEADRFDRALYRGGAQLDEAKVWKLAEPLRARSELEACMASEQTATELATDVALAHRHGIRGTPLLVINDRRAPTSLSLVYALALAGGNDQHPGFATLPPPRPAEDPADAHPAHPH